MWFRISRCGVETTGFLLATLNFEVSGLTWHLPGSWFFSIVNEEVKLDQKFISAVGNSFSRKV